MNVADSLVTSFEGTVRTDVVTLNTLIGKVVTDVLLVDLVVAFQGAVDVNVLAVSYVGVQMSIQVFQWPTPATPPLFLTARHFKSQDSLLVFDLLKGLKSLCPTSRTRPILLFGVYAGIAVTLPTTARDGQFPGHQGTLLTVEIFRNRVYKLTLIALGSTGGCHFSDILLCGCGIISSCT